VLIVYIPASDVWKYIINILISNVTMSTLMYLFFQYIQIKVETYW